MVRALGQFRRANGRHHPAGAFPDAANWDDPGDRTRLWAVDHLTLKIIVPGTLGCLTPP